MNILFVGSIYSDKFRQILESEGLPSSSAGQTFQRALLSGLSHISNVKVISEYYIPSFPKFRKVFLNSEQYSKEEICDYDGESISFVNISCVKKISQLLSYVSKIRKYVDWADAIIVYEVTSRQLLAPVLAKKGKTKIVIVPDLPEFMSDNKNVLYLMAKKIDRMIIDYALKKYNGFVLLSQYMKEKLNVGKRPWMLMEGIFNLQDSLDEIEKDENKVILYTGKIEKWFGLEDLLRAFTKVEGNKFRLWICGPGDVEMVRYYMHIDKRIEYKGCLTHEEVLVYQKKATLLVNPRHSTDAYTLYSFPSKTMEYMASGTPTLMCRLKSLPEEYMRHLYLFEDESVNGMALKIQECLNKKETELHRFGKEAANFIVKNKSSQCQSNRLVKFIKTIINE